MDLQDLAVRLVLVLQHLLGFQASQCLQLDQQLRRPLYCRECRWVLALREALDLPWPQFVLLDQEDHCPHELPQVQQGPDPLEDQLVPLLLDLLYLLEDLVTLGNLMLLFVLLLQLDP